MKTLSFLAAVLWLAFSGYWYTCKVRCACSDGFSLSSVVATKSPSAEKATPARTIPKNNAPKEKKYSGPLLFNCNESTLIKGESFAELLETLKPKAEVMDSLHIKGFYSLKELNRSKYENLGLARAQAIREALKESFNKLTISIDSEKRVEIGIKCDEPFQAEEFTWQ